MARRASPGYNRVAGTNAIGSDTQEDGVTLLPRAITFGAGAGSTGLVIQGTPTSTWPFRLGTIAGLTGGNAGSSRTIDGFTSGQTISVKLAFLSPIQPGDQFQILSGCDRMMATCINVFNNQQLGQKTGRFGGFVYSTPGDSSLMDDGYECPFEHLHDTEAGAKACKRVAVTGEAETWLGTPYHHMGRVKGAGTDCLMMLAEVYEAVGIVPHIEVPFYPPDWHLHRDAERYLYGMMRYARQIPGPPEPGDAALFKFGRCFAHGAIVIEWPCLIHAWHSAGVLYANAKQPLLAGRPVRFFDPFV